VEMDKCLLKELRIGAEFLGVTDQEAVGDLCRLLHNVAELTGELEPAVESVGSHRFDAEGGAPHGGPGQPGDHAGSRKPAFVPEHGAAQVLLEVLGGYLDRKRFSFE